MCTCGQNPVLLRCKTSNVRPLCLLLNDFDSSYETLLEVVNINRLHISRVILIVIETFKTLNKMSPLSLQDLLSYKNSMNSLGYDNLEDLSQSTVNHLSATRPSKRGIASQIICAKSRRL